MPAFKQKKNQELEEKKRYSLKITSNLIISRIFIIKYRILIENPQVYQLYNDLVVGQLVPAEDFWRNYINVIKKIFMSF